MPPELRASIDIHENKKLMFAFSFVEVTKESKKDMPRLVPIAEPVKVLEREKDGPLLMALTLVPQRPEDVTEGKQEEFIVQSIMPSEKGRPQHFVARSVIRPPGGDVGKAGNFDKSILVRGEIDESGKHIITGPLVLQELEEFKKKRKEEIQKHYDEKGEGEDWTIDCLGEEDPDCYYDPKTKLYHLYATSAWNCFKSSEKSRSHEIYTYLAHASGPDIDNLTMTEPSLAPDHETMIGGKEVVFLSENTFLVESNAAISKFTIDADGRISDPWPASTIALGKVDGYGGKMELLGNIINPDPKANQELPYWIQGHGSPVKAVKSYENGLVLAIINGRGKDKPQDNGEIHFDPFTFGFALFDTKATKLEDFVVGISREPVHKDKDAKNVTFASEVKIVPDPETGEETVTVYYHCDDEYVSKISYRMSDIEKYAKEEFPILAGEPIDAKRSIFENEFLARYAN